MAFVSIDELKNDRHGEIRGGDMGEGESGENRVNCPPLPISLSPCLPVSLSLSNHASTSTRVTAKTIQHVKHITANQSPYRTY